MWSWAKPQECMAIVAFMYLEVDIYEFGGHDQIVVCVQVVLVRKNG